MPKSLALGNGNILLLLDSNGQVHDFYFPYVGLENHSGGRNVHRIGVWVDKRISWLEDRDWEIDITYKKETLVSAINARNSSLALELVFQDVVYNEQNILVRKVGVKNLAEEPREVKLFFNQQFHIYETKRGDTAYFDPDDNVIIHYKGRRNFLVGGKQGNKSFDDYSIGIFHAEGKEGTWKDAADGVLTKNPVEHGSVDSTIGFTLLLKPHRMRHLTYWIIATKELQEAKKLHHYVLNKTPSYIIKTTEHYWKAWVNKLNFSYYGLSPEVVDVFKKSLLIIRTHVDNRGGIIASADYDLLQYGKDTYSYVWPRDAAYVVLALDKAGYFERTRKFFEFCNDVITDDGYLLHKYLPDKAVGSSWHPWIKDGKKQLAIQEDETAIVLYSLWEHYLINRDLEFIEEIYNSFIKKAAEFMIDYRDSRTKLPHASYDLWEEKFGTSTYTSAAVYGALKAAANFAQLLGKDAYAKKYSDVANEIKSAILMYLYREDLGYFVRQAHLDTEPVSYDTTLDASSFYGIYRFGVLDLDDPRLQKTLKLVEEKLGCDTPIGGIARYVGDRYHAVDPALPGNPWFITTLWLAQYHIAKATTVGDLEIVKEKLEWVVDKALYSGILSEQLNPHTGEQLSVAPLTWSHAEYVVTIVQYLEKLKELGICEVCYPVNWSSEG